MSLTESAHDLLTIIETASEEWPGQSRIELDARDSLVVTTAHSTDGRIMFRSYRLVGANGWQEKMDRSQALRTLEAFIRRETESAVVAAGELVTA